MLVTSLSRYLAAVSKGFVLLSYIHNFGKDTATYSCMLSLQELQVIEWARRAGLLATSPCLDPRISEPAVYAVLRQLRSLLLHTSKLKTCYMMTYSDKPTPSSGTQPQSNDTDQAASLFQHAVSNSLRSDIMSRAGAIESNARWPRRVWWAAVDKDKFQELLQIIEHSQPSFGGCWTLCGKTTCLKAFKPFYLTSSR